MMAIMRCVAWRGSGARPPPSALDLRRHRRTHLRGASAAVDLELVEQLRHKRRRPFLLLDDPKAHDEPRHHLLHLVNVGARLGHHGDDVGSRVVVELGQDLRHGRRHLRLFEGRHLGALELRDQLRDLDRGARRAGLDGDQVAPRRQSITVFYNFDNVANGNGQRSRGALRRSSVK